MSVYKWKRWLGLVMFTTHVIYCKIVNNNNNNNNSGSLGSGNILDDLQIEHRYTNGGAAAEIVAILEEAREGREERKR